VSKIVHTDTAQDVTETFAVDHDGKVAVRRSQDVEPTIDAIARANVDGVNEIPGLGRLVAEVPITVGIEFCEARGIPWEKFMYSNQYDAEFKRFIADRKKFQYRQAKRLHTVQ
jgi:hypothetical protein